MKIRRAHEDDTAAIQALWREFEREIPAPDYVEVDEAQELREIEEIVRGEVATVAEDDDGAIVGFALARRKGPRLGYLSDLYVVPGVRQRGVARALVAEIVAVFRGEGLDVLDLEVQASNRVARAAYESWGFEETVLRLAAPLDVLEKRLALSE